MTLILFFVGAAFAQEPLSLPDAVRRAQSNHPAAAAAGARIDAAGQNIEQARAGFLPKVNYQESYQRSDNPVFVFGTLLTQGRFTEQNFAINRLNDPPSVQNFQSLVTVDQTLYDFGMTRRAIESARLRKDLTEQERRALELNLAASAARSYLAVLLSQEALAVAHEAVLLADADLQRAQTIRAAGMSTDVDVLSIRVHQSAMREQEIRRRADLEVARAALNEALGAPLDTSHTLTTRLTPLPPAPFTLAELEQKAIAGRPDTRQAQIAVQLAEKQVAQSRTALYPQISARAVLEADRGRFVTHAGANWFAGLSLRWNLFNGYADRSRIRESEFAVRGSQAQQKQVSSAVQLQVRRAWADFTAASERIASAEAAIAQSDESLRITRNRYEAGLNNVTDLLRNQVARLESNLRRLMAVHDQRVAAAMLEFAAGTLTPDSEVLR